MAETSLQARRSLHAVERIGSYTDPKKILPGLPILVRSQGVLTALTIIKDDSAIIAQALVMWLGGKGGKDWPGSPLSEPVTDVPGFVRAFVRLSAADARAVEHEALRYAEMLKLIGKALAGKGG